MSEAPLHKQNGLSEDELNKMKPVEQKFHEVGDTTILPQLGLSAQKSNLKNLILKCLINFNKAKAAIDPKDSLANDNCLDKFSDELTEAIVNVIKGQKWNVTTNVNTDVSVVGWNGKVDGITINTVPNTNITNE